MQTSLSIPTAPNVRTRPPRSLEVVLNPSAADIKTKVDWSSWYLTDEEDMGESCEQNLIIRELLSYLTQLAKERKWQNVFIGADQFFAWVENEPLVRVSPDVYLLDDPPPRPFPDSWQTWLPGHKPPRLAFEIVSKDYNQAPAKYAQLGTQELIIFDPQAVITSKLSRKRVVLQIFRRAVDSGFIQVYQGTGPARSEELDAWLVVKRDAMTASLGIARNAAGTDLVLSTEQILEQEAQARQQADQVQAQERLARQQAERLLAEAVAELQRLKNEAAK